MKLMELYDWTECKSKRKPPIKDILILQTENTNLEYNRRKEDNLSTKDSKGWGLSWADSLNT